MVTVGHRIFIFGGITEVKPEEYRDLTSFSVAEYIAETGGWQWAVREQPYPDYVPDLGYEGEAIVVYGGEKVLLCEGLHQDDNVRF